MIAQNHNFLCKQVEPYYYDFLYGGNREPIPEFVFDHVEQCQNCHEQIEQLRVILSQVSGTGSKQEQANRAVITMLELHFAYIGEPVTCRTARPFIPGLLDPALQIRVPTPITAHLDNCRQCSESLEAIRELNLNPKQLRRLSQMFIEESSYDAIECSEMAATARSVAAMNFGGINSEDLGHLCKCSVCRNLLFDERQKLHDSLPKDVKSPGFSCDSVLATDIFDYVVPVGLEPANDQYIMFRESLVSHLRSCPTCLTKMQELHRTIYGIADRAESKVVTIYRINEFAETQTDREPDDLYAGFPISVEVTGCQEKGEVNQPQPANGLVAALKRKISTMNLKPLAASVAVAAVILIGFALIFNPLTARAVTIEQIYKAIEKVKNVHTSRFEPGKTEPVQEIWILRKSNVYMTKTGENYVLWDLANRIEKVKSLSAETTKTTLLSDDIISSAQEKIGGALGLVPFSSISEIPQNADWNQINSEIHEAAEGIEICDMNWTEETYGGSVVFKKWRFFVDSKSNFPKRVEMFRKSTIDGEYILSSVVVTEYLSDNDIEALVKSISF